MSVISTLRDRATTTPSDEAFVFMDYDTKTGDQIDRMTWSQLYSRVTAVSAYLISYGRHADRRRTAAISAPQGLDYVAGFLGALCAGWAPVPLPEPLGSLRDKRTGLAVLDCAADVASRNAGQGHDSYTWGVCNYAGHSVGYIGRAIRR